MKPLILSWFLTLIIAGEYSMVANTPLVLVKDYFPRAILDIRYATPNNFTHRIIYSSHDCYIHKDLITPLQAAEKDFLALGYRIKFWDCYRPTSAQEILWSIVPDERYITPPWKGSRHSKGTAVDITLTTLDGVEVVMPTPFDDFGEAAHINFMELPAEALNNRKVLQDIMLHHGFSSYPYEWWHFDWRPEADYPILNVPL